MCASTYRPLGAPNGAGPEQLPATSCVGITIPIPEPLATELERWRASFGDPMAVLVPPHITLITTTPATDWQDTIEHVRGVAKEQRAFTVTLRSTGSFRPLSPVVFLRVDEGFEECVELHGKLQAGPLERDPEFPFHPHVTVAHDVSDAGMDAAVVELESFEASFPVRSMGLYEHQPSGVWKLREELSFGEDTEGSETSGR
ncbi:2'-5' RNA ligase family protein [Arthrobacter sp. Br18]|uniref:2'-5' RNA ligase family protein n=1 Tax=Arthrobacter sp. Br18 TaxID=1312954 RepID=UPI0004BAC6D9|nr:2'-5' RNA ligase family protein [Arthrobacter sp. Br18]